MGLDGYFNVVFEVPVFGVGDVADAEEAFDFFPALVGDGDGSGLLVDDVIAGPSFVLEGLDEFAEFELGDDDVDASVLVGGLVGGAGDDERGAGFVDEDGVYFVDDAVVVSALNLVLDLELHVVAEVVEAELVVGAVGDIGGVGFAALLVVEVVDDDADGEAEEAVDLAHPFGVAFGEVVVDGDDVDAVAGECVEVAGKRGDEGFAFAGLHLGDLSGVEDDAADHLDVEVPHLHGALAGLADDGEGFGEDGVESGLFGGAEGFDCVCIFGVDLLGGDGVGDALAELGGFVAKVFVGERLDGRLKGINLRHDGLQALDGAFVAGAKDFCND